MTVSFKPTPLRPRDLPDSRINSTAPLSSSRLSTSKRHVRYLRMQALIRDLLPTRRPPLGHHVFPLEEAASKAPQLSRRQSLLTLNRLLCRETPGSQILCRLNNIIQQGPYKSIWLSSPPKTFRLSRPLVKLLIPEMSVLRAWGIRLHSLYMGPLGQSFISLTLKKGSKLPLLMNTRKSLR